MLETVKTRLHQAREWLMDYAYLVTLGAMIAVIAGTALYTDHLRSQQNVQAAAPAPEVSSSPTPQISTRSGARRCVGAHSGGKRAWPAYAPFACARRAKGRSRFNLARSLVFLRFAEKGTSEIHPIMVY